MFNHDYAPDEVVAKELEAANEQSKPEGDPLMLHVKTELVFQSDEFMPKKQLREDFNHMQLIDPPVGSIEHNLGLIEYVMQGD